MWSSVYTTTNRILFLTLIFLKFTLQNVIKTLITNLEIYYDI